MTTPVFREDAYARTGTATVVALTPEGGVVLDRTVFYPTGGGQPGDSGWLTWNGLRLPIATAIKGEKDAIVLVPSEPMALPDVGVVVEQSLDWERRHRLMRVHTALHLLSVAVPFGVTGGSISATHGRLDFNMEHPLDNRDEVEATVNRFVEADAPIVEKWISQAELDANPGLVKTMSVQPPRGAGNIRLIRIGTPEQTIDLQPCGGTHVARTGEIGNLRLGKIEKKGRMNRRIYLHLDG